MQEYLPLLRQHADPARLARANELGTKLEARPS
jgi:hypothetical protein